MVEKFDRNLNYISSFVVKVPWEKYSTFPLSICVDSNENIYISDEDSDLVKVFDKNGFLIHRLGEWSNLNFRYKGIVGQDLAISDDEVLFVVNYNKISLYKDFKLINEFRVLPKNSKTIIKSIFYDKKQSLLYVLLNFPNKILVFNRKGNKKSEISLD